MNRQVTKLLKWAVASALLGVGLAAALLGLIAPNFTALLEAASHPEPEFAFSAAIFLIELAVIVVGVPVYIRYLEHKKWSSMRDSIVDAFYAYRMSILKMEPWPPTLEGFKSELDRRRSELFDLLSVLSPSVDSDMSPLLVDTIKSVNALNGHILAEFRRDPGKPLTLEEKQRFRSIRHLECREGFEALTANCERLAIYRNWDQRSMARCEFFGKGWPLEWLEANKVDGLKISVALESKGAFPAQILQDMRRQTIDDLLDRIALWQRAIRKFTVVPEPIERPTSDN
jgi:hypothetical protein